MKSAYWELITRTSNEMKLTINETTRYLALQRCGNVGGKKSSTPFEVVSR